VLFYRMAETMRDVKYDRTARLLRVLYILNQNPKGIAPAKIAEQCGVTVRTTFRDLKALEDELKVPMWGEKGKRGIEPGRFLPPISFNLPEAMTIFLASRLLLAYTNAYNPSIETTFTKLNSVVPGPLREQIRKTIEWMQTRKADEHFLHTLETLARAWMYGRRAKIRYWTLGREKTTERIIEPYFIQPAALEHANYIIAYCHLTRSVRTFKLERIESLQLLDEDYTVPEDFDANQYLDSALGITIYSDGETIEQRTTKLKFSPEIARIAEETMWHPSQITQRQPDGSVIVTMNLSLTVELLSFILGWGEKVEVMEPKELRQEILETARGMVKIYQKKRF
jgi:predicted DNA-binding transcriptional regulator YafY